MGNKLNLNRGLEINAGCIKQRIVMQVLDLYVLAKTSKIFKWKMQDTAD